mmetsp:Transcript_609/g.814  ORF Transcript_609/g.814 Transcript_609/m.814 type:complete len:84 (+) Transcript_609:2-253(+)
MESAGRNPHVACGAMRCLKLLYTMQATQYPSIGNNMRIDMNSVRTVTGQAWEFGKVNHLALERESRSIIKLIMKEGLTARASA